MDITVNLRTKKEIKTKSCILKTTLLLLYEGVEAIEAVLASTSKQDTKTLLREDKNTDFSLHKKEQTKCD